MWPVPVLWHDVCSTHTSVVVHSLNLQALWALTSASYVLNSRLVVSSPSTKLPVISATLATSPCRVVSISLCCLHLFLIFVHLGFHLFLKCLHPGLVDIHPGDKSTSKGLKLLVIGLYLGFQAFQ
jgi:hypothetical protein